MSQEQWELLEPLLPDAKRRGRPRSDLSLIVNAIFYVLCEGCTWRGLPGDFPAWQTVYTYFRNWRRDGTWVALHDQLYKWSRVDHQRPVSPSELIIDSQSVKPATMVHDCVGYDGAKTTPKRGTPERKQAPPGSRYFGTEHSGAGYRSFCPRA